MRSAADRSPGAVGAAPLALLLVLGGLCACRNRQDDAPKAVAPTRAPQPKTPDRLPPGQLLEGEERAFGLVLPRDMTLERQTKRIAHVHGRVSPQALGEYLRARVLVQHVEMSDSKLVFPKAQLRGDAQAPLLRLEIIDEGLNTHLIVHSLLAPPVMPGLTDEQRWERAGRKPGGALDAHNLE